MTNIPAHRRSAGARSGDAIAIGADGEAINVDQQRRDEAAAAATAKAAPKAPTPKPDRTKPAKD